MKERFQIERLAGIPWLAEGLAALGGILFSVQLWIYAHTQFSVLDEGIYLYKGYAFVTGKYIPFQDYGFWTNHMPLSFLIPGYVQAWFGPGIRTGRYLGIFLAVLGLVGVWITARRLGGKWWAALAVLTLALNPAVIKMYSQWVSQGLIFCMLAWVMVLTLGADRPRWQLASGTMLAGAMLLTRINLAPVLFFLILYLIWQHGWRTGLVAAGAGLGVVVIGHALYWPGILRMWSKWLPDFVPFLDAWRLSAGGRPYWDPPIGLEDRVMSFFFGIRSHLVPVLGAGMVLALGTKKEDLKRHPNFKAGIFLLALAATLFLLHLWASPGQNYCVFCFQNYLSFFSQLGIYLVIIFYGILDKRPSRLRQIVIGLLVLFLFTGLGFAAYPDIGEVLLTLPAPRIQSFRILPGSIELWGLLANKFGFTYEGLLRGLPAVFGFLVGLLLLGILAGVKRYLTRRQTLTHYGLGTIFLAATIGLGLVFSPIVLLGGGFRNYDCEGDMIASYEAVGAELADMIPAGAQVFLWVESPVPMLYLPEAEVYPPQLNDGYAYYLGGDPEALLAYGYWNDSLAWEWLGEADYILVRENVYYNLLQDMIDPEDFSRVTNLSTSGACKQSANIVVLQRIP